MFFPDLRNFIEQESFQHFIKLFVHGEETFCGFFKHFQGTCNNLQEVVKFVNLLKKEVRQGRQNFRVRVDQVFTQILPVDGLRKNG